MSLNVNHVILAGHLTRDPEIKNVGNDRTVASFGLAVNRRWKSPEGEQRDEATFIDVIAWGRTAELIGQYLTKGSPCYLEGSLKFEQWEKDGVKHSKLRVQANTVHFMGKARDGRSEESEAEPALAAPARSPATAPRATAKPRSVHAAHAGGDEPPF